MSHLSRLSPSLARIPSYSTPDPLIPPWVFSTSREPGGWRCSLVCAGLAWLAPVDRDWILPLCQHHIFLIQEPSHPFPTLSRMTARAWCCGMLQPDTHTWHWGCQSGITLLMPSFLILTLLFFSLSLLILQSVSSPISDLPIFLKSLQVFRKLGEGKVGMKSYLGNR